MATEEYTVPYTIVRAEPITNEHKMTAVMRNLFATEISEALDRAEAFIVSQGRQRNGHGGLELVWIATGCDLELLTSLLAEIAGAYSTIGIMLYADSGAAFVQPLQEQTPPWLDALASSVTGVTA